jgi:phosphinothricin tripeptide acetyl hydrolase
MLESDLDEIELLKALLAHSRSSDDPDFVHDRTQYERAADDLSFAVSTSVRQEIIAGVFCEIHIPAFFRKDLKLIYLHGGGYVLGSPHSHRHLASEIATQTCCITVVPNYSKAPEAVFPTAIEEIVRVANVFARGRGAKISLAGDSAGGALALAASQIIGKSALRSVICLSPWLDLTCNSVVYRSRNLSPGSLNPQRLLRFAQHYLGQADPRTPLASPIFARPDSFPPIFLQVAADELFFPECQQFASAIDHCGGSITFRPWHGVIHVWQWYWPMLALGKKAIVELGNFVKLTESGSGEAEGVTDAT